MTTFKRRLVDQELSTDDKAADPKVFSTDVPVSRHTRSGHHSARTPSITNTPAGSARRTRSRVVSSIAPRAALTRTTNQSRPKQIAAFDSATDLESSTANATPPPPLYPERRALTQNGGWDCEAMKAENSRLHDGLDVLNQHIRSEAEKPIISETPQTPSSREPTPTLEKENQRSTGKLPEAPLTQAFLSLASQPGDDNVLRPTSTDSPSQPAEPAFPNVLRLPKLQFPQTIPTSPPSQLPSSVNPNEDLQRRPNGHLSATFWNAWQYIRVAAPQAMHQDQISDLKYAVLQAIAKGRPVNIKDNAIRFSVLQATPCRPELLTEDEGADPKVSSTDIPVSITNTLAGSARHARFRVVSSVAPRAAFNDAKHQATKDAASMAGLTILRTVDAPTTAAAAFGTQDNKMTRIDVSKSYRALGKLKRGVERAKRILSQARLRVLRGRQRHHRDSHPSPCPLPERPPPVADNRTWLQDLPKYLFAFVNARDLSPAISNLARAPLLCPPGLAHQSIL
ncbi:hypothetical protein FRC01_006248, partial [Tulasnella sp. 417]